MEAASEEFRSGLRHVLAARRLEAEAQSQAFDTAMTLFSLAADFRVRGVDLMMVGDCIGGEEPVQPPVTRPAKSQGMGRDDSTSLDG